MERIIMHIDVNSAFLSWSAVKLLTEGYPKDIRNEVSVIAGDPSKRHGVIVAASIPAKKLGIRPPTTLFEARKIYRNIIVVKPDMNYYKTCSNRLISYLKKIFPLVEQYSIDECFIDYTSVKYLYKDEVEFANKLKDTIFHKFGFTVNIGIGNNKLCAKMASDFEKPNKVHTLYLKEFKEKMYEKDISDLFMAGKSSCAKLRSMGINKIGELANFDVNILIAKLKSHGKILYEYANGIDNSKVDSESYDERKSIGISKTLPISSDKEEYIYKYLLSFASSISKNLGLRKVYANTLTITIRNDNFKTINHSQKYLNSFHTMEDIYKYSKELLKKIWDGSKIRLIGLSAGSLTDSNNYQLSLFEKTRPVTKTSEIDDLISNLNKKLGNNVIVKGNSINSEE